MSPGAVIISERRDLLSTQDIMRCAPPLQSRDTLRFAQLLSRSMQRLRAFLFPRPPGVHQSRQIITHSFAVPSAPKGVPQHSRGWFAESLMMFIIKVLR